MSLKLASTDSKLWLGRILFFVFLAWLGLVAWYLASALYRGEKLGFPNWQYGATLRHRGKAYYS